MGCTLVLVGGILMLFDSLVRDWVVADLLPNDGVR